MSSSSNTTAEVAGSAPYRIGFSTLGQEIRLDDLPVEGTIPAWLTGTLVRNGPAKFEIGNQTYRHWFDGLAMLHRFSFQGGRVSYANRFLESRDCLEARQQGRITRGQFATDPCRSIFSRVMEIFFPQTTENANVSINLLAKQYVALTETPMPVTFDLDTLRAAGVFQARGRPKAQLTTAHPHLDFDRRITLNYCTRMGRKSMYQVFSTDEGGDCRIIGSLTVDQPAYMHSFGMTERYIVLVEFPLRVRPLDLLLSRKPFIENFRWKPDQGSRFWLIRKEDGRAAASHGDSFFSFHHVNAFESGKEVLLDIAAYTNASIIESFYLDKIRDSVDLPPGELRRYRIRPGSDHCTYDVLSPVYAEFPRINYRHFNGRAYRYVFGAGSRRPRNFIDQIVKVDIENGTSRGWFEEACYPGEPVFVAAPGASREDEGVILSIVLNANTSTSFLLVLDAQSFQELGRAAVPHHIPFGLHGQYLSGHDIAEQQGLHR